MKRGDYVPALLDKDRVAVVAGKDSDTVAHFPDDRCANKDGFEVTTFQAVGLQAYDPAVELPPISIALNRNVYQAERFLRRIGHFFRDQDRACTGPKHRFT